MGGLWVKGLWVLLHAHRHSKVLFSTVFSLWNLIFFLNVHDSSFRTDVILTDRSASFV